MTEVRIPLQEAEFVVQTMAKVIYNAQACSPQEREAYRALRSKVDAAKAQEHSAPVTLGQSWDHGFHRGSRA